MYLLFNHMVNYSNHQLDNVFHSLADPTRRDIIRRVSSSELSVGQLVVAYDISFPAITKHLKVLESSNLIIKRKEGRNHFISLNPQTLKQVDTYLERYRLMWEQRYYKLDQLLQEDK